MCVCGVHVCVCVCVCVNSECNVSKMALIDTHRILALLPRATIAPGPHLDLVHYLGIHKCAIDSEGPNVRSQ